MPVRNELADRTAVLKLKLERYYENMLQQSIERQNRKRQFGERTGGKADQVQLRQQAQKESEFLRFRRVKLHVSDFETLQIIGRGAFGVVKLVQKLDTGRIYAMKIMLKSFMIKNEQMAHARAERDALAESESPWVVQLYYSFQDAHHLYLLMEYLPGGDMMTQLIHLDVFPEDMVRFYMAECVLAIESVHALGFVHRDIKPDNILFDDKGHIKLTDFGLSTGFHPSHDAAWYRRIFGKHNGNPKTTTTHKNDNKSISGFPEDCIDFSSNRDARMANWRRNRRAIAYSTVGTPDYIAPEVFYQRGYGKACDWWSLGAIMYEMLIGFPPFCGGSHGETYHRIINWRETLKFPKDMHISSAAEHLIRKLLCDVDHRLGGYGADEVKSHPFFSGIDWDRIRTMDAPFVPKLKSINDTAYFPVAELQNEVPTADLDTNTYSQEKDLAFVGYTFRRFETLSRHHAI